MPAKGADVIETEAPEKEPQLFSGVGPGVPAIVLSGVSKHFESRRGRVDALAGLNFTVEPNEVLGVVGPSGCGKSTLLELICGLDEPTAGSVAVGGREPAGGRLDRCALMHQRDLLLPWRSALDNATLALELRGVSRRVARERVAPLFDRFGLEEFTGAKPYELSGGMRQRVAFLRTLLADKPVLLLDEPFGSLDSITRAGMQAWLADALLAEPRTVVLVSHDVEEALFLCDRVLVLSPRPGQLKAELEVSLVRPRPRRVGGSRARRPRRGLPTAGTERGCAGPGG
jgi:ABC-type nitrate/sulfonate/bicarbonate transport system ATPase subunit